jgi:hypothetical protein
MARSADSLEELPQRVDAMAIELKRIRHVIKDTCDESGNNPAG